MAATPCARLVEAERIQSHLEWLDPWGWPDQGLPKVQAKYRLNAVAGRIDVSRSLLFEQAKKADADACIQLDADVEIQTPLDRAMLFVADCYDRGYDLVIWPTVAADKKTLLLSNPNRPNTPFLEPWEVTGGAFGGVVMSRKVLKNLKPISEITFAGVDEKPHPLYCTQEGAITEDYSFCNTVTNQGMKVCADPRVIIGHKKGVMLAAMYGKEDPRFRDLGIPQPVV